MCWSLFIWLGQELSRQKAECAASLTTMKIRLAKTGEEREEVDKELEKVVIQSSNLQLQIQDLEDMEFQNCQGTLPYSYVDQIIGYKYFKVLKNA